MLAALADSRTRRYCAVVTRVGKLSNGNDVGSFGEDRNAVHDELERASPLVKIAAQNNRAESAADGLIILNAGAGFQLRVKSVHRLAAVSVRIPQIGMRDVKGKVNVVDAGAQFHIARGAALLATLLVIDSNRCRALLGGCDFGFHHQVSASPS